MLFSLLFYLVLVYPSPVWYRFFFFSGTHVYISVTHLHRLTTMSNPAHRYREVHDLWHVLSGLPPTVEGELALKWFELVQTGLPVCALGAVFGPLALPRREPAPTPPFPFRTAPGGVGEQSEFSGAPSRDKAGTKESSKAGRRGSREVLAHTYVPWAVRAGRRTRKPLMCVWYERRWEQSLEKVRRELEVEAAPLRSKIGGELRQR